MSDKFIPIQGVSDVSEVFICEVKNSWCTFLHRKDPKWSVISISVLNHWVMKMPIIKITLHNYLTILLFKSETMQLYKCQLEAYYKHDKSPDLLMTHWHNKQVTSYKKTILANKQTKNVNKISPSHQLECCLFNHTDLKSEICRRLSKEGKRRVRMGK